MTVRAFRRMARGLALASAFALSVGFSAARAQSSAPSDGEFEALIGEFVDKTLATNDPMVLAAQGEMLTEKDAVRLEGGLIGKPNDLAARSKLLGFYAQRPGGDEAAKRSREAHILWLIEHAPESEIADSRYAELDPRTDDEACSKALDLWLKQTDLHPTNVQVLGAAGDFLTKIAPDQSERLFRQAAQLEPGNPLWPARVGSLLVRQSAGKSPAEREALGKKALSACQRAIDVSQRASDRLAVLPDAARAALAAGDPDKAEAWAQELIDAGAGRSGSQRQYPLALHEGHTLLGLVAIARSDNKKANDELVASAAVFENGGLARRGPSMELAAALLAQGDRNSVVGYLKLCAERWPQGKAKLTAWSAQIEAGKTPADWTAQ